jgi:hypothetical protein
LPDYMLTPGAFGKEDFPDSLWGLNEAIKRAMLLSDHGPDQEIRKGRKTILRLSHGKLVLKPEDVKGCPG